MQRNPPDITEGNLEQNREILKKTFERGFESASKTGRRKVVTPLFCIGPRRNGNRNVQEAIRDSMEAAIEKMPYEGNDLYISVYTQNETSTAMDTIDGHEKTQAVMFTHNQDKKKWPVYMHDPEKKKPHKKRKKERREEESAGEEHESERADKKRTQSESSKDNPFGRGEVGVTLAELQTRR